VFAHLLGCHNVAWHGFDKHVPAPDRGMNTTDFVVGLATLQAMFRDSPADELTPTFADDWLAT